jgi:hypothetical protein
MISAGIRQMVDVNIRAFLAFLQDRSDVWPATGPWGSTSGPVALANSEQKFAKWQIEFIDIFLRDLVDFSPMQQCQKEWVDLPDFVEALRLARARWQGKDA